MFNFLRTNNTVNILPERARSYLTYPIKKFENERELFFKEKYRLNANYIFYPASFYPHKNHIYILKVLDYLNNFHNKNFYVYFVGTTPNLNSTLTFLKKNINQLNIKKYVKFFDFVEDESIYFIRMQFVFLCLHLMAQIIFHLWLLLMIALCFIPIFQNLRSNLAI